jgi:hypothetical protein
VRMKIRDTMQLQMSASAERRGFRRYWPVL